jgi:hypothetical protein
MNGETFCRNCCTGTTTRFTSPARHQGRKLELSKSLA